MSHSEDYLMSKSQTFRELSHQVIGELAEKTGRLGYMDACPECGRRDIAPSDGLLKDGMVSAQYQCPECDYAWGCCWEVVDGWVIPPAVHVASTGSPHDQGWDYNAWTAQPRGTYSTTP